MEGQNILRRHDSRQGLGYGQLNNKFHSPRKLSSSFPYLDKDPYSDEEFEDLESEKAINKKLQKTPQDTRGDRKSADPFYFVAGNTKLSDCFFRVDKVLLEVHALGDSMSPIPNLYKGPKLGMGSSAYITNKNFKPIGSKSGFSSAPPPINDEEDDFEETFYDLSGLAKILRKDSGE